MYKNQIQSGFLCGIDNIINKGACLSFTEHTFFTLFENTYEKAFSTKRMAAYFASKRKRP